MENPLEKKICKSFFLGGGSRGYQFNKKYPRMFKYVHPSEPKIKDLKVMFFWSPGTCNKVNINTGQRFI